MANTFPSLKSLFLFRTRARAPKAQSLYQVGECAPREHDNGNTIQYSTVQKEKEKKKSESWQIR
jgi:hypothetical protein